MNKYLRVALSLASAVSFVMAWQWVYTFEPASPLVPFGLVFLSGFAFRQAID